MPAEETQEPQSPRCECGHLLADHALQEPGYCLECNCPEYRPRKSEVKE